MNQADRELMAVSPLDGRYSSRVVELSEIVSEMGLIKYRVIVELAWLNLLASGDVLPKDQIKPFTSAMTKKVNDLAINFNIGDARAIKQIEATTNHDVKAVEMWIRQQLSNAGGFEKYLELVHFGRTSEDINNLAYGLMILDVRNKVLVPAIDKIGADLEQKAHDYAGIATLAQTHGQPATPTTLGKEMAVYVERLTDAKTALLNIPITGKLNGATGTYGADLVAFSQVDWPVVSRRFVESLGLKFKPTTTQIEPHDNQARLLNELALINTILIDLSRDMWAYISRGVFKLKVISGEVGSSTMPHKVNPIDFENAEGNFGLANALAVHLAGKLPLSRLQRDLTDSTAQRAFGEIFGHSLVGYKSLVKGLSKVEPNNQRITDELSDEWSILAEALQTVMRKYGIENAYEKIKKISRGQAFTKETYKKIVKSLDLPKDDERKLLDLTPQTYTGLAEQIAKQIKF